MPMYALCIYGSHIVSSVFPLSSQNVGSSACMTRSCSSGMTSTLTTSCRGWRQLKTSMRGTWLRLFCLVSVNEKIEVWWRPYCITSKVAVVQDAYEGKWMWWSQTTRGLSWWGIERILKHTHTHTHDISNSSLQVWLRFIRFYGLESVLTSESIHPAFSRHYQCDFVSFPVPSCVELWCQDG